MGSADIIPGVSGGTIALIVGIYERFIIALQSINFRFIYYFLRGFVVKQYFQKAKDCFFSINFSFLIPLAIGILVAFVTLANVISIGLDEFPTYTFAFFFGLIFSSSIYVYLSNRFILKSWVFFIYVILGFFVSYYLVGLETIQMEHSILIIFIAGLISFCAMILPGLSGAFILLMLGQYVFMLDVLRNLSYLRFEYLPFAISFSIGGLIGLIGFSKILSYLIKKYHMQTLSFILGLMIGALRKPGEFIILHQENNVITLGMIGAGILIVTFFSYYEFFIKKKDVEKTSS
jgi:putative membrane protein